jgi:hypothetical protein
VEEGEEGFWTSEELLYLLLDPMMIERSVATFMGKIIKEIL